MRMLTRGHFVTIKISPGVATERGGKGTGGSCPFPPLSGATHDNTILYYRYFHICCKQKKTLYVYGFLVLQQS